jgi:Leucine-rich repeat (LRR) protein
MIVACCGCDAIKSIGQEEEEGEEEVASSEPSLPPEGGSPIGTEAVENNPPPVEPEAAPQPTPEEILAAFLAKPADRRNDEDLEQLAMSPDLLAAITELDLSGGSVSDYGARYLPLFPDLERVHLRSTRVTSEGIKHLAACTKLIAVTLDGLRLVDDIGVRELSALPIQEMSLRSTSVTDGVFEILSEIEELRILHLDGNANLTGIPFRGLTEKFSKLQVLTASNTQMGYGLQQIGELNDLEVLNIGHAEVSDEVLQQLAQCRKLVELDLSNNLITLLGVPFLARLNDLQQLNLRGCSGINDEALNSLGRLENLRRLDISGTQCTLEGAQRLKERLADTVIVFDNEEL